MWPRRSRMWMASCGFSITELSVISSSSNSAGKPEVVRALVDAGVAVSGVTSSTRLEDVFLALVHDPRAVDGASDKEPAR